ncbi:MAG: tRNA (guanine(46)-N(7))-methyltransferase TrmB [Chelatococcus sp.]|jgi:tRNA (guanine-N7-)-methyltransferase|uniref:tRNA (guanine(46)-N(7))-methyltransferase TrmB n=1 Tax=unclassified Chelatococcus TaxID=2638111 RepID=UPI001BCDE49C|nr:MULTISPECIES: tRNA (guanine(46)-N(7))-methyltransferase TrmB [unclassified Chelatococcus]CAH1656912.1 tRNA (guanine-N(7)-)-methyltransferase [Hyphomicrobiales bacterium]MBS7740606.1 tRNA (guanine(46)-N(7))-methyltransferase TrmB [Chelatococcus sp. HY11]MBX3537253.1 tRNA (guanine(46)-N(7))-methyltransferase TrmB [Chelatococcus sp.]MBX3544610.1 tRNA (guanine(46)-N(7))-methyltransferase TrmB [Chelatococcus sp.]MCO5078151.1 tRNA (guanine(46)-N(7))-methyltransferase TrmB [Chelatococcus sp.]
MIETEERRGAFWGRRVGHKLREHQSELMDVLLPHLMVPEGPLPPPEDVFGRPMDDLWLEIGFGGGEHLLTRAEANRDIGFIGCEPFINGMAKLLAGVEERGLDNIRLFDEDAALLLPRLGEASVGRAFLLYPDPWPKRRHRKRRFVSDATLKALARVLKPGAAFCFATDIDDYAAWTLARILRSADFAWAAEGPDDWRRPWAGWPGTRYEAKALREGRTPGYFTFIRQ